jgi:hypothetical protein
MEQTNALEVFGKLRFDAEQDLAAGNLILMRDTIIDSQVFGVVGTKLLLDVGNWCDRRA